MGIMRRSDKCRSCNAHITWCVSAKGNFMPIDRDPVVGGTIRILHNPIPNARVQPDVDLFDPDDDGLRYVAHHATCPDAEAWRAAR